jgi:hypothetical protein
LRHVFLLLALSLAAGAAQAETQFWVNPGVYSVHFDRGKDLRDDNIGVGVESVLAPRHSVGAGTFINSNRERSRYVAYAWRPWQWNVGSVHVLAGVIVGAFDGYPRYRDGGWFVAPLPLVAVEGRRLGVNLSLIPTIRDRLDGAIAIQVKLRVW